ncbi:MAG: hypothetical protein K2M83_03715 [Muribaculaceae bacterium]|nr:hypothetical protein [Muribaculaceae bacterium]
MKLTDKRVWITSIPIFIIAILISVLIFYRHNVEFEEIGRVRNSMTRDIFNFYPYGFALIHNESDLEYYKMCLDTTIINTIDKRDFTNYSYLITFGNRVEKLSYSWYDTFLYDVSPSYCKVWKTGNELLIVDYPGFTHKELSIVDAALMGTDSIYIYQLPHLPFLRRIQGL